jgi:hypothetical protein
MQEENIGVDVEHSLTFVKATKNYQEEKLYFGVTTSG